VGVVAIILYVGFVLLPFFGVNVWIFQPYTSPLWLVIPVAVGVWIVAGLGVWLGWIMATTKEVAPPPVESKGEEKPAKPKKK
jgi:hypothetical protein